MKFRTLNRLQAGATLMEVMVAMSISLVVTAAMIGLMSNSLGSTTRIIQMTKLSDDLRVALQMMSRDVRRSSYNANSMYCYANNDCDDDGVVTFAEDITIADWNSDGVDDCFTFTMDRDYDGDSTEDAAGGFRRVVDGGVGIIEMWTGGSSPDCTVGAGAAGWVQITNPENMNISFFLVSEQDAAGNDLFFEQEILNDGVNVVTLKSRKLRMSLEGRLVIDPTITRQMEDIIAVRNDLLL